MFYAADTVEELQNPEVAEAFTQERITVTGSPRFTPSA
jgi:hypothetical protein